MNRFLLLLLVVFQLVSLLASQAAAEMNYKIEKLQKNNRKITHVDVFAKQGRVHLEDISTALSKVNEVDVNALVKGLPGSIDLEKRRSRLLVAALNLSMKDAISLKIINADGKQPQALRITIDHLKLQEEKRALKDKTKKVVNRTLDKKSTKAKNNYGLHFDKNWQEKAKTKPLVILVHGFNSNTKNNESLIIPVRMAKYPTAMFDYPNDSALAESAKLLSQELKNFKKEYPKRRVALLAYSMGGLVSRAMIENPKLDPGNVDRLVMVATPNHGSKLAKFAHGIDILEYGLGQQVKGTLNRFNASFSDGLAEATTDLKPGSIFLTQLNKRKRNGKVKYTLILGSAGPLTQQQLTAIRKKLDTPKKRRVTQFVSTYLSKELSDFDELVDGRGDGVVSLDRGKLAGVKDTIILPFSHWSVANKENANGDAQDGPKGGPNDKVAKANAAVHKAILKRLQQ